MPEFGRIRPSNYEKIQWKRLFEKTEEFNTWNVYNTNIIGWIHEKIIYFCVSDLVTNGAAIREGGL